jgi:ligand-binding sensor domain-containing protein
MPQAVRAARPLALALDPNGDVWGAGPNGLVRYDGTDWQIYGADVLPVTSFVDVESDPEGTLWILSTDRVLIVSPGRRIED